jgi:hypothetical protein
MGRIIAAFAVALFARVAADKQGYYCYHPVWTSPSCLPCSGVCPFLYKFYKTFEDCHKYCIAVWIFGGDAPQTTQIDGTPLTEPLFPQAVQSLRPQAIKEPLPEMQLKGRQVLQPVMTITQSTRIIEPHTDVIKRGTCPKWYELVVVLDGAASPDNFYAMKQNAVAAIKSAMQAGLQFNIAVIQTTSKHPQPEFKLGAYIDPEQMLTALLQVQQKTGQHYGNETLNYVRQRIFAGHSYDPKLILYMASTTSRTPAERAAASLRRMSVRIRTVGIGISRGSLAENYLKNLAGDDRKYYEIPSMTHYFC